ncbi:MAG: bacteriohemerythrin [Treponema sp.]|jgi:hemerythrin|nr:bacteriohemerythrin [Treponema sp.]
MSVKIEYVTWSNSYSLGIKQIDEQHKGLLVFVNDLFNHVSGDEKQERLYFQEVIHQAIQYVKEHFATEERLMVMTKFPGYTVHKRKHDEFTLTVVKSVKDFEAGKRLVLEKFAYFLKDWVLSHIAFMDAQYAQYFRQIATRKTNGKLTITKADVA